MTDQTRDGGWRDVRPLVVGTLIVAFLLRVLLVVLTPDLPLANDPGDYVRLGKLLAHTHSFGTTVLAAGGGPTAFRPPLYPLFVGGVFSVAGDHVLVLRLVQAAVGTVTVALIGLVACQLWDRRIALIALVLAAFYLPLFLAGSSVLSESIFLPIELGAVAAALEHRRHPRGVRWPVVCGALLGLAVLARPNSGVLLLPLALLLWRPRTRPRAEVRPGAAVLVLCLTAVVVVAPWQVRNVVVMHAFVPVSDLDGFDIAGVYNASARHNSTYPASFQVPSSLAEYAPLFRDTSLQEVELSHKLRSGGLRYLKHNPTYFFEVVFWNSFRLFDLSGPSYARLVGQFIGYDSWLTDAALFSYYVVGLLAVAGAFTARARRVPLAVYLCPLLLIASTVVVLGTSRYRAPIEPFIVLLASLAIAAAWDRRPWASAT